MSHVFFPKYLFNNDLVLNYYSPNIILRDTATQGAGLDVGASPKLFFQDGASTTMAYIGYKSGADYHITYHNPISVGGHVFEINNVRALTMDQNFNIVPGSGALATNATNGFQYMIGCAGTPSGTPGASYSGRYPFIYNSSAKKICVWDGAAWVATAALS